MARKQDWTRGYIRYRLEQAGIVSLYDLDTKHKLPLGTCSNVIGEPHQKSEAILAAELGVEPGEIWPSRYDAAGNRLRPQPSRNYRRRASAGHRQNRRAA